MDNEKIEGNIQLILFQRYDKIIINVSNFDSNIVEKSDIGLDEFIKYSYNCNFFVCFPHYSTSLEPNYFTI